MARGTEARLQGGQRKAVGLEGREGVRPEGAVRAAGDGGPADEIPCEGGDPVAGEGVRAAVGVDRLPLVAAGREARALVERDPDAVGATGIGEVEAGRRGRGEPVLIVLDLVDAPKEGPGDQRVGPDPAEGAAGEVERDHASGRLDRASADAARLEIEATALIPD